MATNYKIWKELDHNLINYRIRDMLYDIRLEIEADTALAGFHRPRPGSGSGLARHFRVEPPEERRHRLTSLADICGQLAYDWLERTYNVYRSASSQVPANLEDFIDTVWNYGLKELVDREFPHIVGLAFGRRETAEQRRKYMGFVRTMNSKAVEPSFYHGGDLTESEIEHGTQTIMRQVSHNARNRLRQREGLSWILDDATRALIEFERRMGNPAFQPVAPPAGPQTPSGGKNLAISKVDESPQNTTSQRDQSDSGLDPARLKAAIQASDIRAELVSSSGLAESAQAAAFEEAYPAEKVKQSSTHTKSAGNQSPSTVKREEPPVPNSAESEEQSYIVTDRTYFILEAEALAHSQDKSAELVAAYSTIDPYMRDLTLLCFAHSSMELAEKLRNMQADHQKLLIHWNESRQAIEEVPNLLRAYMSLKETAKTVPGRPLADALLHIRSFFDTQRKKRGRPRQDALSGRVQALRDSGHSWGEIQIQLNKETGVERTMGAYRNLLRSRRESDGT